MVVQEARNRKPAAAHTSAAARGEGGRAEGWGGMGSWMGEKEVSPITTNWGDRSERRESVANRIAIRSNNTSPNNTMSNVSMVVSGDWPLAIGKSVVANRQSPMANSYELFNRTAP